MSESTSGPGRTYRDEIAGTLTPVRPVAAPARRVGAVAPLALALVITAPLLWGERGDLALAAPALTWGATGFQFVLGLWWLTLSFREAVPGRNISTTSLAVAAVLTVVLFVTITLLTNAASPTVVAAGREWQYWVECVLGPAALGAPFMIVATLLAGRAFPTRPAVAGALSGLSAGVLSDAGWRLSCWISEPAHVIGSHAVAVLGLALAGSLLAVVIDRPRWK